MRKAKDTKQKRRYALTLIELITVMVIVSILAAIAMPKYFRNRELSMDKQAKAILSLIRAAERAYYIDVGHYYPYSLTTISLADMNTNLSMDLVNDGKWTYQIDGGSQGQKFFRADLTRSGTSGYPRNWYINSAMVNASCEGDRCL